MRKTQIIALAIYGALALRCGPARDTLAQAAQPASTRPQLVSPTSADPKKAVLDDTDHLLLLARELKADVDKTRRDELSMRVIRDADELEKLARSVKARIH